MKRTAKTTPTKEKTDWMHSDRTLATVLSQDGNYHTSGFGHSQIRTKDECKFINMLLHW